MSKRTLLSWSSGKDSAWALHQLQQDPEIEVVGLFTTINERYHRVAMHAVRVELLQQQADAVGLPLDIIALPSPCSNEDYERIMTAFVTDIASRAIDCIAFGDLFLEDIRRYREAKMQGTGLELLFPLWNSDTTELANTMITSGLKAITTCVDPKRLPENFCGQDFDHAFLDSLPAHVDACGENGEFHTFVYDDPMFTTPIPFSRGEVVERDGFIFADLLPA